MSTATLTSTTSTAPARPGPTAQFRAGAVAITPMVVGVAPFGLAIGSAAAAADIPTSAALASSPLIFAGAAQLTATQMLDAGVAPLVIVISALMINARILLYSTSLAPWFSGESLGRRLLLAVPVIDQLHFTCVPRFAEDDLDRRGRVSFYAGAAITLTTAWLLANTTAILIGSRLPDSASLQVAAPLALAGLLAKSITDRSTIVAAAAAAAITIGAVGIPFRSVVLVATLGGVAVGSFARRAGATS